MHVGLPARRVTPLRETGSRLGVMLDAAHDVLAGDRLMRVLDCLGVLSFAGSMRSRQERSIFCEPFRSLGRLSETDTRSKGGREQNKGADNKDFTSEFHIRTKRDWSPRLQEREYSRPAFVLVTLDGVVAGSFSSPVSPA